MTPRFPPKVQVLRAAIVAVLAISMLTENWPNLHSSLPGLRDLLGALHLRQNWELFIGYPHRRDRGYGWSIESAAEPSQGPQFLWPDWPALRTTDFATRVLYYINAERVRSIHHKNDLSPSFADWKPEDLQALVAERATELRRREPNASLRFRLFRVQGQSQVLPQPPWPSHPRFRVSPEQDQIRFQLIGDWPWPGESL